MSSNTTVFDEYRTTLESRGADGLLELLEEQFRASGRFHELFEVLKMQARRSLKLPLVADERLEDLEEQLRATLEDRLLEACRVVGTLLMEAGKLREGWLYLRPLADRKTAQKFLLQTEVNDQNLDELIELSLGEGIAPAFGYELMLNEFGTCNSITAFETQVRQLPRADQRACARLLVQHLHAELLTNVRGDVENRVGSRVEGDTIAGLIADRDWLFGDMSYHIDTTHLASVVRFARICDDPEVLRLALDLCEYGARLNERFQFESEEPFQPMYAASRMFFAMLVGQDIEAGLKFFRDKADATDVYHQGSAPAEVYIDLLARTGRHALAAEYLIQKLPPGTRTQGIAPTLFELCRAMNNFRPMLAICEEKDDRLGFATALICES
ncbi:MAG: hypothetical protein R3B96_15000 [Pirellulaceae bacterium]